MSVFVLILDWLKSRSQISNKDLRTKYLVALKEGTEAQKLSRKLKKELARLDPTSIPGEIRRREINSQLRKISWALEKNWKKILLAEYQIKDKEILSRIAVSRKNEQRELNSQKKFELAKNVLSNGVFLFSKMARVTSHVNDRMEVREYPAHIQETRFYRFNGKIYTVALYRVTQVSQDEKEIANSLDLLEAISICWGLSEPLSAEDLRYITDSPSQISSEDLEKLAALEIANA